MVTYTPKGTDNSASTVRTDSTNNIQASAPITSVTLPTKTIQAIQNIATKINKMYLSKRLKYRNQLSNMLAKQQVGTTNYEIIHSLIEQIKKN